MVAGADGAQGCRVMAILSVDFCLKTDEHMMLEQKA